MNVHVLQHAPFEGLGSIRSWLEERGAIIRYTRFFRADPLPDLDAVDLLIAMGGPMSVNDEHDLPWLVAEKQLVRDAVARDLPVLGICLGAQLVASAMGARVYRNRLKEIGWFPVRAVQGAATSLGLPPEFAAFHWHGETFDLPPGAERIATSDACVNQGFRLGRAVVGLQFHLEMTADAARDILGHCREDLTPGPYVQKEADILAAAGSQYHAANRIMSSLLEHMTLSSAHGSSTARSRASR